MKRNKIILLILLIALLIPNIGYGKEAKPKAYFVVINKVTLEDIESMDKMKDIIKESSLGLMNTRGTSSYLGAGSYLTINASGKADANDFSMKFEKNLQTGKIKNKSIAKINDINNSNKYMPYIGAMGDNLHKENLKTGLYGTSGLNEENRNPTGLIIMDSQGEIDYGNIDNISIDDERYPFDKRTDYVKLLEEVENTDADLIAIDTGDLERLYRFGENLSEDEYENIRSEILADLDIFMEKLIDKIDLEKDILIITSPNQGDTKEFNSRLSPIIILGSGLDKGSLISSTTRRENIISNIDIAPTIMDFFGATKENMVGKKIETTENQASLEDIIKVNNQINTTSKVRYKSLLYYGVASMLGIASILVLILLKIRRTNKFKKIISLIFMTLLAMPNIFLINSILKPTSIKSYNIILFGLIILFTSLIWMTKKSENQALYISGFTVFLIFTDIILKGKISMYSVLSHDPIIGARYYGVGNEMVGLLLGSTVVFGKKLIEKNNNRLLAGIIFLIGLILIGNPSMGANVGGTLTFLVTLIIYLIGLLKLKIDYKKIVLGGIIILLLISLVGYFDININENTSHLGNTILLIKDKGLNQINNIVIRKVLVNIRLIGSSFWTYLLLLHMFFYMIIFNVTEKLDKNNLKTIIPGIIGIIVGFLLNDSGIILAAIAMNIITLEFYINGMWESGKSKVGEN